MKRRSFSFDVLAWQNDVALRSCSVGARGLWIEMLCLMHQAEPYGYLVLNGQPIEPATLARLVGATEREVRPWLAELEVAGVFQRDDDGVIYGERLLRDERIRSARAAGGKLGGNPELAAAKGGGKVNLAPTIDTTHQARDAATSSAPKVPEAASRSQPSTHAESAPARRETGDERARQFARFLSAWPLRLSGEQRLAAARAFKHSVNGDFDRVMATLEGEKQSEGWQAGEVPKPSAWLAARRWEARG